ncbi:G-protein coupled receptor moody-like isoform X1 [Clavelina lepadiformis]|uniref:G-protein coupled receptor moody-like isoform X1 n=1 Tax=Clavelina lepadiformis TaxID=159417 RepID=UPI004042A886
MLIQSVDAINQIRSSIHDVKRLDLEDSTSSSGREKGTTGMSRDQLVAETRHFTTTYYPDEALASGSGEFLATDNSLQTTGSTFVSQTEESVVFSTSLGIYEDASGFSENFSSQNSANYSTSMIDLTPYDAKTEAISTYPNNYAGHWMSNTTFPANFSDVPLDRSLVRTFGIIIGIFDICVGSVGNLLTIIAILSNKKLHKPFHIFIANLCVIDFLTATTMMPFNVNAYVTKTWPFGEDSFTCSFMAFSYYCCGYTSIVCLLTITVNRFVGVVYPKHYDRLFSKRRMMLTIIISWLFAPVIMLPFFFFKNSSGDLVGYGWATPLTLCVFLVSKWNDVQRNYMQFTRVLFQFLPLLIMIVLYAMIFRTSKNIGMSVTKAMKSSHSDFRYSNSSSARNKSIQNRSRVEADETTLEVDPNKHNKPVRTNLTQAYDKRLSVSDTHLQPKPPRKASSATNEHTGMKMCRHATLNRTTSKSEPGSPVFDPMHHNVDMNRNHTSNNEVRKSSTSLGGTNLRLSSNNVGTPETPPRGRASSKRIRRNYTAVKMATRQRKIVDRRLLRISVAICLVFMILFLPSVIVNLFPKSFNIDPRAHMFASIITWFNSCVNPIIYCFMNARMRSQYRLLLRKACNILCRCMKSEEKSRAVTRRSLRSSSYRSVSKY